MISPARVAAFEVLSQVSAGRADLPSALARARPGIGDTRDRALAAEIATGVQRHRAALDHVISVCAKRPSERLDPEVLEILRLSAYQILHLTRVPVSAVVDDAVKLATHARKRSAAGFVNAVLRTLSRTRQTLALPRRPPDASDRTTVLDYFSVTLSHPRWLCARWLDRFGFDAAERWLLFDNEPAPLTLRANRLHTDRDALRRQLEAHGVRSAPGRFGPDALIVEEGQPLRDPGVSGGDFVVQDEASQLVALLAGAAPGPRVLDACASPGGKATALAAAVRPGGTIIACDVRDRRMALLRRTVDLTSADNVRLVQADLLTPLPFLPGTCDCVLVDAPCSGLGTLRRDPDIRWKRREGDLEPLAASQRRMLQHAAEAVSPGGRLVYATCSSEPEENEAVAADFLMNTPGFSLLDAQHAHPLLPPSVVDGRGHFRTSPAAHGLEAFFGAVFTRLP